MRKTIIVVPCYNEEKRLPVQKFQDFARQERDTGFIFANDGSTDGTARVLEVMRESDADAFGVHNLATNSGKAEAVRQGLLKAFESNPAYVGFLDADLATPLEVISQFRALLDERPDLEIVIGSRVQLLGRKIERRALRHYLGRFFATAASLILNLKVYDTQCGAKLFRASAATRRLFEEPFLTRWLFDVEIIARLIRARRGTDLPQAESVIYEYPLMEWRDVRGSKITLCDCLKVAFELYRIHQKYFRRERPPRPAGR